MREIDPKRPTGVLIVDDCPDTVASMAFLARAWGHQARTAPDGKTALALAMEHRPAVVLLDIGLPDMTGYDLAKQLRELSGMGQSCFVAVTGYGMTSDQACSAEAGCQAHLVKPVDPDLVRRFLDEYDAVSDRHPVTAATLAAGLDDLYSAAAIVEAIDDPDGHSLPGWDLSGWGYLMIPWGVCFTEASTGEVVVARMDLRRVKTHPPG